MSSKILDSEGPPGLCTENVWGEYYFTINNFMRIKNPRVSVIRIMCYKPKQILLRFITSPCGRFLTSAHLTIRLEKLLVPELRSSVIIDK